MTAGDLVDAGAGEPSVLLAEVESLDAAVRVREELARARPGEPFAIVVSTDVGVDLIPVLEALREGTREVVCCDPLGPSVVPGHALSLRLLDDGVLGQDLAYTVPAVEAAVDHARACVADPDSGWEAAFVLLLAPRPVLDLVQRHLAAGWRFPR